MRLTFAALVFGSTLALIQSAPAQTPDQQPSSTHPSQGYVEEQHPEWFHENYVYRPCPAAVVFRKERHACLGTP
jgi:hypothetical protein